MLHDLGPTRATHIITGDPSRFGRNYLDHLGLQAWLAVAAVEVVFADGSLGYGPVQRDVAAAMLKLASGDIR